MSLVKVNSAQIGQSATATQNFTLAVPASPDGTVKLARGNSGATTQDVLTVDASGNVNAPVGLQQGGVATGRMVLGTAVATTSGTSIDFTGIPSWVKRITVTFSGVSTSGSAQILIQIGTSGGVVATGYLGTACNTSAGVVTGTNSTGFRIEAADASITTSSVRHGAAVLTNITANTWCFTSAHGHSNTNYSTYAGGSLSLGGVLDRLRITTTGTDTFDAGSANILYEG